MKYPESATTPSPRAREASTTWTRARRTAVHSLKQSAAQRPVSVKQIAVFGAMRPGWDVLTVMGAFAGFIVALLILANYIGEIPGLGRLTLKPQVAIVGAEAGIGEATHADAAALLPGWQRVAVGDTGLTAGPLRPGGKMSVDDYTVDVVTEGDFVENGQTVKVIAKQGTKIVVRAV